MHDHCGSAPVPSGDVFRRRGLPPEEAKPATQAPTVRLSSPAVLQMRKQSHALAHRH
ncbi:MAG: hypothetical protein ABI076_11065 [Acidobacteriaceae bacterium]